MEKSPNILYSYRMLSRFLLPLTLSIALLGCAASSTVAWAGDEDRREEEPAAPPPTPEPEPAPAPEPELPDFSLGEEPSPEFQAPSETRPRRASRPKRTREKWNPDKNIDYGEILGRVEPGALVRGVLAPAQGFRGYRPNMIAVGYGDRTPGWGAMLEYSWNRVAMGAFYSYRDFDEARPGEVQSQSFGGLYGLYRWLPFDVSPHFLLGLEVGSQTRESFGGMAGIGVEAALFQGWTALLGYTYHTTVGRGFFGGAFGWSF